MESISDVVAEMRRGFNQSWDDIDREWAHGLADRIESAANRELEAVREDANDDTEFEMNCGTCAHYDRNRQYCPIQDLMVARCCSGLLPILDTGPCGRHERRFAKKKTKQNEKAGKEKLNGEG